MLTKLKVCVCLGERGVTGRRALHAVRMTHAKALCRTHGWFKVSMNGGQRWGDIGPGVKFSFYPRTMGSH